MATTTMNNNNNSNEEDEYEYEYYDDVNHVPEGAEIVEYVYEDEDGSVYTETYKGEFHGVTPATLSGVINEEEGDEAEEYEYGTGDGAEGEEGYTWEYLEEEELKGGRYVRGDDGYLYYEYDDENDDQDQSKHSGTENNTVQVVEKMGVKEKEAKGWQGSGQIVAEFMTNAAGRREGRGSMLVVTGQGGSRGVDYDDDQQNDSVGETKMKSFMAIDNSTLGIDDYVIIDHPKKRKKQIVGKISYIGNAVVGPDLWVGVTLLEPVGTCDGSVDGQRYFHCSKGHGVFIRPVDVRPYRPTVEYLADFNHCGFLTKQGKIHKNWKRRFFILTKDHLHYFADPMSSKELGKIEIAQAKVQESSDGKPNGFKVAVKGRTYVFAADNAEEAEEWIRNISDAHEIANARHKMAKEYQKNLEEMKQKLISRRQN